MPLTGLVLDDLGVLAGTPQPLTAVLAEVRAAGVPVAVLSNADGAPRAGLLALQKAGQVDALVLSGATGLRKPQLAAYVEAARQLGLAPEQCAYVDDLPDNVRGAAAAGMAGVLHRHAATTRAELAVLFGARVLR